jgi:hypothetical protein
LNESLSVYISPNHPKHIRDLYAAARTLKKDTPIQHVFVYGLKVMAKMTISDEPFEIKDLDHLQQVKTLYAQK